MRISATPSHCKGIEMVFLGAKSERGTRIRIYNPDASVREIKQYMYSRGWVPAFYHLHKDRRYGFNIEQGRKLELRSLNQARTLVELSLSESGN